MNGLRSEELFKKFEKTFNECYNFLYNSNVRYKIFKFLESQNDINLDLIKTHEIRWISIKAAIHNFDKLYSVIIEAFDYINNDKSKQLKQKITDASFIFLLNWSLALCDVLNNTYLAFQSDNIIGMEIHEYILTLKIQVKLK